MRQLSDIRFDKTKVGKREFEEIKKRLNKAIIDIDDRGKVTDYSKLHKQTNI